jgi:hypothetical protein
MEKAIIHLLSNIKLYMHLTAIISYFLFSYLFSMLFGFTFLGIEDAIGLIICYFAAEWYHQKNAFKMKELLKEIRMKDWE